MVRKCTRCHGLEPPRQRDGPPGLEHPGTQRTRTAASRDEAARDRNVRGKKKQKEKETAAERNGEENKNKSKEQMGKDKKEIRREVGGEREEGEAAKHMEPGWEHPGKQRTGQDQPGAGRHWRSSNGSFRGAVRKRQRQRQEPIRSA